MVERFSAALYSAAARPRFRSSVRVAKGPAHVLRLGHCVLNVSDFRTSERWYKDRFGFLTSDEIEAAPGLALGAFMRCDRGNRMDHLVKLCGRGPRGIIAGIGRYAGTRLAP